MEETPVSREDSGNTPAKIPFSPPIPRIFTLLNGDIIPRIQEVEIASSLQIPHFQVIGLPGPEVSEAKDRIRAAIESAGFDFPKRKIVLNLSPASVRKQGTGLDFAMGIAVLLEGLRIDRKPAFPGNRRIFAWGELGLNGQVKGVGSPARALSSAIEVGADLLLISLEDEPAFRKTAGILFEAIRIPPILAIGHLSEVLRAIRGEVSRTLAGEVNQDPVVNRPSEASESLVSDLNLPGRVGPLTLVPRAELSKLLPISPELARTLEIAASGSHHFLLLGPKGVGKSQAIEWFLALQPVLDRETLRTRTFLAEISGRSELSSFRRVSTQTKPASLVGSFANGFLRPGEFSLAHGGVLIADEFPEWHRDSREILREPLERKKVTLTRVDGSYELPCDFIFAGNGNLCPCGGVPDSPSDLEMTPCRCHPNDRAKYLSRLSGPILDRLDLVSTLLNRPEPTETRVDFPEVEAKVTKARARLIEKWGLPPGKLSAEELEALLREEPFLRENLDAITFRSFRDRHKTLRIALTIAALRDEILPTRDILREARLIRIQGDRVLSLPH